MGPRLAFLLSIFLCSVALSSFDHGQVDTLLSDSSLFKYAYLNGNTFINKGLVAFGFIPSDFVESTDGSFSGTIVAEPDGGFNVDGTVNYQDRQHEIDFTLRPYRDAANLSFTDAQKTLTLEYRRSLLYWDVHNARTTGLDALSVRNSTSGFLDLPIASENFNHLSVDCEGLVINDDGSFWVSDKYGPFIYRFAPSGHTLQAIQPPAAFLPFVKGSLNFTSDANPDTGRIPNQGFEGLTASPDGRTLYALLQSATIQDGGSSKKTNRFTRLLAYDVSSGRSPSLVGEWIVPLPQNSEGDTLAQSEVHFVSPGVFLVLARDGDGRGGDDNKSSYKRVDLFDISNATDIHESVYDDPANPIAVNGVLNTTITYVSFVDLLNPVQLSRFGLHNGEPADKTLVDAKWESIALAPVDDAKFPSDYFLFVASDNDFLSTQGRFNGQSFDAGADVDNQFLVYRVSLPTTEKGSVEQSIGIQ